MSTRVDLLIKYELISTVTTDISRTRPCTYVIDIVVIAAAVLSLRVNT